VGVTITPLAEIREDSAGVAVELEDWIDRVGFAVDRAATGAAGGRGAAAFIGPDVAVDRIDIDARGRAPLPAGGQLAPVADDVGRRVRQSLAGDRIACGSGCRRSRRGGGALTRPSAAARCQEKRSAGTNNEA
jgi:hypothetical protein